MILKISGLEVDPLRPLVLHGRQDSQCVQIIRNGLTALSGNTTGENLPYRLSRLRVNMRVEGTHEAIISQEDFRLAARLTGKDTRKAPGASVVYPLSEMRLKS